MTLEIRLLQPDDIHPLASVFAAAGWNRTPAQFQHFLNEQEVGSRTALIALKNGQPCGYVTVHWRSGYPPFRTAGIPEIQDFNVLPDHRRRGIGSALMDAAEAMIAERCDIAGIGVGMDADYGAAQCLYVRRGYIPDGRGLTYQARPLRHGDQVRVDDDLVLYLTKEMPNAQRNETSESGEIG